MERNGNEVVCSSQFSPDKELALKMVVGACIFHQALTALFAFILCSFDILFLVARQASRQGALRGRSVLSSVTGRCRFPISNNTCGKSVSWRSGLLSF